MSVRYISDNLYITTGYSSDKQFSLRIKNLSIDCIFCYNDNFYNLLSSMLLEFVKEEFLDPCFYLSDYTSFWYICFHNYHYIIL
jgi:hypothetical protein